MIKVVRIPPVRGCYGERFIVNDRACIPVYQLFQSISLWTCNTKIQKDGSTNVTFEMPAGTTVEENLLVMHALNKYRVTFVDFEEEMVD